jgi:hypothetical protein
MTEQNIAQKGNQLANVETYGTRKQIQEIAYRLKYLIIGGKKLSDDEAIALAQYSYATGLDPFTGECYYLPGIGPGPGIAGWRHKADEELEYEMKMAGEKQARFWCDYLQPASDEVRWDPAKGDIAVKVVLHDSLTRTAWERRVLSYYIELKKADVNGESYQTARELAGPEPVWTSVGVVYGVESFGATDKMPRHERACKRGEKACLRKRFPRLHLSEPDNFISEEEYLEGDYEVAENPFKGQTEEELIRGMGYDPDPPREKPNESLSLDKQLVNARIAENLPNAKAIIKLLDLDNKPVEEAITLGKYYRGFRDLGFSSEQAASKVKLGEVPA